VAQDKTQFGRRLKAAMEEQGVSIRQLAEKIEAKYESVRKVVVGDTTPSTFLLNGICSALNLSKPEMKLIVEQDRVKSKLGRDAFAALSGVKPGVERINDAWDDLSPGHRADIQNMVLMYANQDKFSHQRKRASA
jgi:transcriptional regulator with XRE-family HTH domain